MKPDLDEMIVPEGWGFVTTMDRREFVTLTSVGLLVMFGVKPAPGMVQAKWNPAGLQEPTSDFNAFIHIGADGRVLGVTRGTGDAGGPSLTIGWMPSTGCCWTPTSESSTTCWMW